MLGLGQVGCFGDRGKEGKVLSASSVWDGNWLSSSGNIKTVTNGCYGNFPIAFEGNMLKWMCYEACTFSDKTIFWNHSGQEVIWTRWNLEQLDGDWLSSSGGIKTVTDGCLDGFPITVRDEKLQLKAFKSSMISNNSITWQLDDTQVVWTRLGEVSKFTPQPRESKPEVGASQLDGDWLSSSGGIKTVKDGCFGGSVITLRNGILALRDYEANIHDREIVWESENRKVIWNRWQVGQLDGDWLSSSGSIRTVKHAQFAGSPITLKNEKLMLKDYEACTISNDEIIWEHDGQKVVWTRWRVDQLNGTWLSSSGVIKTVRDCHFGENAISMRDGSFRVKGYTATVVSEDEITWELDGEEIKWKRWWMQQLDGDWSSSLGGIKTVSDGCLDGIPFILRNEALYLHGYKALVIKANELVWEKEGDEVTWNRCRERPSGAVTFHEQRERRKARLAKSPNIIMLCHATRQSNALQIFEQTNFRPGSKGYLGPGIYFSKDPYNAKRCCQCHTGSGPIVILRCRVSMGRTKNVVRDTWNTAHDLLEADVDSLKQVGKDCYMIPNNDDSQICMKSISTEYM